MPNNAASSGRGLSVNDTSTEDVWCECPGTTRRHLRRENCPATSGRGMSEQERAAIDADADHHESVEGRGLSGMQPGDDRLPPLIDALHKERTATHTERVDCWACAAADSVVVQDLAVRSSTLAAIEKRLDYYGAPAHYTPLARVLWLLDRMPSPEVIKHALIQRGVDPETLS